MFEISGIEKAISSFRGDFNCAQSILSSFATQYGLDRDTALRLSSGFGGGMARLQNTCGAVSGAFMVIGLRYGMGIMDDTEAKEKTYQIIKNCLVVTLIHLKEKTTTIEMIFLKRSAFNI